MTPAPRIQTCIVIPAYNEAGVIGDVVSAVFAVAKKANTEIDVVVVDDGSTDKTALRARENGAIVISHVINCGAGAATATGLRYAKKMVMKLRQLWMPTGNITPRTFFEV